MSWSSRIVIRTFSGGNGTTGPRLPLLRSYSRFIFACPRIVPALARWLCALKLSECCATKGIGNCQHPSLGVRTECHVAFFRRVFIQQSDSTVIVEHDDRIKELDSVLAPVRFRLFRVPLKLHRLSLLIVCTVYTASCRSSIQVKLVGTAEMTGDF